MSSQTVAMKEIYRMRLSADITPGSELLHVHVTGVFALDESNAIITLIFQSLAKYAPQKVLVDFRQTNGEPTIIERFLLADFMAKEMDRFSTAGVSRNTRFACLGTEPMVDRGRFGETVAVNRGLKVKVTESMVEALGWLELESTDIPLA